MVPFKIDGKSFEIPQHYGALTLGQFLRLKNESPDFIGIISILSGIERAAIEQVEDIDLDYKIAPFLEWLKEPFDLQNTILPSFIEISGKQYDRPTGLGINTYGQKLALQNEIEEKENTAQSEIDCYPYALALYMQPIVTGKPYDEEEVQKLIPEILKCRLSEAWPIASFFLSNYEKYLKRRSGNFLTLLHQRKYKRALADLKSSETFRQYSLSRRLLISLMSKCYSWTITLYSLRFGMNQKRQDSKRNSIKSIVLNK